MWNSTGRYGRAQGVEARPTRFEKGSPDHSSRILPPARRGAGWKIDQEFVHIVQCFARRDNFYLVVVGSGPEFDHLQFLAETLIPGRYYFAGNVPRVVPYYELADVVVCPRAFSRGEISGAIPEACAAGKPMIVPKIGGWNEYVDDSRGFPVVADDEIDYAEALLHCLENPSELTEKGIQSRHFAEQYLSWEKQKEIFISLYSQRPQKR